MNSLFEDSEHGRSFKNAIFSLWLRSVSEYILRQAKEIYEVKVKNEEIEKESIRRNTILLENPIIEEEFLRGRIYFILSFKFLYLLKLIFKKKCKERLSVQSLYILWWIYMFCSELQDKDSVSESKALSSSDSQEISPVIKVRENKDFNLSLKEISTVKTKSIVNKSLIKKPNLRLAYAKKGKEAKSTECDIKVIIKLFKLILESIYSYESIYG